MQFTLDNFVLSASNWFTLEAGGEITEKCGAQVAYHSKGGAVMDMTRLENMR